MKSHKKYHTTFTWANLEVEELFVPNVVDAAGDRGPGHIAGGHLLSLPWALMPLGRWVSPMFLAPAKAPASAPRLLSFLGLDVVVDVHLALLELVYDTSQKTK